MVAFRKLRRSTVQRIFQIEEVTKHAIVNTPQHCMDISDKKYVQRMVWILFQLILVWMLSTYGFDWKLWQHDSAEILETYLLNVLKMAIGTKGSHYWLQLPYTYTTT